MAHLPLVLQVHPRSKYKKAEELWRQKRLSEPLICLPENSGIAQMFQAELKRRGIQWPQTIEATSLDLVHRYVANGDGIGVNVLINPKSKTRGVRVLPLENFPPVTMGAMWSGKLNPAAQATVEGIYAYTRKTWPNHVC